MNDLLFVAVADSRKDLSKLGSCISLFHFTMDNKVIIELSTSGMFHHQKDCVFGLNNFVELDDIWMMERFHDSDLSVKLCKLLFIQLGLVNDFDGDLVFISKK